MKRFHFNLISDYFLRGIFIIAPLFATIYALYRLFYIIDTPLKELFFKYLNLSIPGLGLISIAILLIIVGYLGSSILMDRVFQAFEKLILRIPIFKEVYKAIKDVIGAFASDKKKFERPVLVKVGEGLYRIGFLTTEDLTEYEISSDLVSVYFPLSYAFTGELLIVQRELIKPLDKNDVKGLMKFVISGGIVQIDPPKSSD